MTAFLIALVAMSTGQPGRSGSTSPNSVLYATFAIYQAFVRSSLNCWYMRSALPDLLHACEEVHGARVVRFTRNQLHVLQHVLFFQNLSGDVEVLRGRVEQILCHLRYLSEKTRGEPKPTPSSLRAISPWRRRG